MGKPHASAAEVLSWRWGIELRPAVRFPAARRCSSSQQPPSWTHPQHAPSGPDARGHRGISRARTRPRAGRRAPAPWAMGSPSIDLLQRRAFLSTRVITTRPQSTQL